MSDSGRVLGDCKHGRTRGTCPECALPGNTLFGICHYCEKEIYAGTGPDAQIYCELTAGGVTKPYHVHCKNAADVSTDHLDNCGICGRRVKEDERWYYTSNRKVHYECTEKVSAGRMVLDGETKRYRDSTPVERAAFLKARDTLGECGLCREGVTRSQPHYGHYGRAIHDECLTKIHAGELTYSLAERRWVVSDREPAYDIDRIREEFAAGGKTMFAPAVMTSVPLKSVDAHNAERVKLRRDAEEQARKTGVACPKCGGELLWRSHVYSAVAFPAPTTAPAVCTACALTVELER